MEGRSLPTSRRKRYYHSSGGGNVTVAQVYAVTLLAPKCRNDSHAVKHVAVMAVAADWVVDELFCPRPVDLLLSCKWV